MTPMHVLEPGWDAHMNESMLKMAVQTGTEDLCRDIFADLEDNFLQSIHPPSVLPTLFAKGLVSNVQRDEIQTAAKSVSRYQACSLLTEALRQLPKGTDTPKIFYRVLQGARGHESIAEKMRKGGACTCH